MPGANQTHFLSDNSTNTYKKQSSRSRANVMLADKIIRTTSDSNRLLEGLDPCNSMKNAMGCSLWTLAALLRTHYLKCFNSDHFFESIGHQHPRIFTENRSKRQSHHLPKAIFYSADFFLHHRGAGYQKESNVPRNSATQLKHKRNCRSCAAKGVAFSRGAPGNASDTQPPQRGAHEANEYLLPGKLAKQGSEKMVINFCWVKATYSVQSHCTFWTHTMRGLQECAYLYKLSC